MKSKRYPSEGRGLKDLGWLKSHLSFSFSDFSAPDQAGFGLLRVFNDDFVAAEKGFGLHAHANMEIVSIMLAGNMSHLDTLGYREVVEKDWVQIMSAGSGLRHEEHNVGSDTVNFLQIWIEPKLQNITPRYQRRYFPEDKRKNKLVTIVSNEEGKDHCWINQNAKLSLGYFEQGQEISYPLNATNKCLFLFTISGVLSVAGNRLGERDAIGIWECSQLNIRCDTEARFLLIEVPINH